MAKTHLIGMLLGVEEDWPAAFEALLGRADLSVREGGETHTFTTERVTIEPFDLRMKPRHSLVIDRLGWWYPMPREWLKKVVLMDRVHLLNNPFTFQAMEKHAAYCAMIRLGLKVPGDVDAAQQDAPGQPSFRGYRAAVSALFRPRGGGDSGRNAVVHEAIRRWRVGRRFTHREQRDALSGRTTNPSSGSCICRRRWMVSTPSRAASASARSSIVLNFHPEKPMHDRYSVDHNFLTPRAGDEVLTILRTVNAFFRWELNSCETLIRGDDVYPIDYANATPDLALTSLHYYFPWAIRSLLKWVVFCCVTGRLQTVDLNTEEYFAIADRADLSYEEKLAGYRKLADKQLDVDRYREFCERHLAHVDEVSVAWVESPEFDRIIVETVRNTFPAHEHEQFIAHFRGLLGAWAHDQRAAAA